ncbi:MAG: squalene synthase [Phototrophicales bacterium]|nr:MAG: squalene synthase [Phototrophicales bacterium]RMG75509.1 MAG: phytoene/squalene synthase family protein [Chloroflexota bacterium]
MTLQMQQPWEYRLLAWAQEAHKTQLPNLMIVPDIDVMQAAYHHCAQITKTHSRTFFIASGLLPKDKRQAARALYAFCRTTDDTVDCNAPTEQRRLQLNQWREQVNMPNPPQNNLVALAWADTKNRFNIPYGYADQLIDGVARDLTKTRYQTFAELAEYAYGVASTVGLMAMHIIGYAGEHALPYAVRLGVALQLTNILRDVYEDWRVGRVYLPQEELDAFGLTEDDIAAGVVTQRWRNFMRFQIARNRKLYEESWKGIQLLNKNGRFAISTAAALYRDILTDIEKHDYNVFARRAHLTKWEKLARLPKIWLNTKRG